VTTVADVDAVAAAALVTAALTTLLQVEAAVSAPPVSATGTFSSLS
jgi:hypothetical protein